LEEAKYIYEEGAQTLIIGTGQYDQVRLSSEAQDFFDSKGLDLQTCSTHEAIKVWNDVESEAIGLFHVTC
jgi:hypothetical protein